uniref:(northern house mosquito) hypothetical protein n=1 Tax=Culex pipiens TaxID=7175 RepID=A0A8D8I679_CULPI
MGATPQQLLQKQNRPHIPLQLRIRRRRSRQAGRQLDLHLEHLTPRQGTPPERPERHRNPYVPLPVHHQSEVTFQRESRHGLGRATVRVAGRRSGAAGAGADAGHRFQHIGHVALPDAKVPEGQEQREREADSSAGGQG